MLARALRCQRHLADVPRAQTSIEDPFDQDDWESWTYFRANSGVTVIGDDLTGEHARAQDAPSPSS